MKRVGNMVGHSSSSFCACLCAPQKRNSPTSHHLPLTQMTNHLHLINEYHLRTGMHACLKNGKKKKKSAMGKHKLDVIFFFFFIIESSHFHLNIASLETREREGLVCVSFSVVLAVVDVWFFSMIRLPCA